LKLFTEYRGPRWPTTAEIWKGRKRPELW